MPKYKVYFSKICPGINISEMNRSRFNEGIHNAKALSKFLAKPASSHGQAPNLGIEQLVKQGILSKTGAKENAEWFRYFSGRLPADTFSVTFYAFDGHTLVRSGGDRQRGEKISCPFPGSISTETVEDMIYKNCLARGREVTTIVREETHQSYSAQGWKDTPTNIYIFDIYDFEPDPKLLLKHEMIHQAYNKKLLKWRELFQPHYKKVEYYSSLNFYLERSKECRETTYSFYNVPGKKLERAKEKSNLKEISVCSVDAETKDLGEVFKKILKRKKSTHLVKTERMPGSRQGESVKIYEIDSFLLSLLKNESYAILR